MSKIKRMIRSTEKLETATTGRLPWLGWAILALTALMSIIWSAHKLLEQDEIFSLQTDRVASLGEVFRIQKFYPISLEPPPYHVLAHAAIVVFGPTAFSLRLPALLGYLLMQFCLYFFVYNFIGSGKLGRRAGLIAMALPAVTWTLYYSAEGRPYGLLLGFYALAALCWQVAARRGDAQKPRIWLLLGVAFSIALTINIHFYGVLLLIPVCIAELLRTIKRRKVDTAMVGAITAGMASLVTAIPYIKASGEFKKHYYAGPISTHMLTQPYRQMLIDYTNYPKSVQAVLVFVLVVAAITVLCSSALVVSRQRIVASGSEWGLVLLLVLMPLFAYVLGKTVTHALEVRHSIGAIVGISTVVAVGMMPALRREQTFSLIMGVLFFGIVTINATRIKASVMDSKKMLSELTVSLALEASINDSEDRNIYFQDLGKWETASLYEPDSDLRSRLVLVYSRDEEMQYEQHDTMYLTAIHTQRFSPQKIVSYEALRRAPGTHIFSTYAGSGWDWTGAAFAREASQVQPLGEAFGGTVMKVRFKQ